MKYIFSAFFTLGASIFIAGLTLLFAISIPALSLALLAVGGALLVSLGIAAIYQRATKPAPEPKPLSLIDAAPEPKPLSLIDAAKAAGVLNEQLQNNPPEFTEEGEITLTAAHHELLKRLNEIDLAGLGEEVDNLIKQTSKIYPCEILRDVKKAYPLGAVGGGAARSQAETARDGAFKTQYENSNGIMRLICLVSECRANYAGLFNHVDDLANTQGYSDLIKFIRLGNALVFLVELEKAIKAAKEKYEEIVKLPIFFAPKPIKQSKDNDYYSVTGDVLFLHEAKKSRQLKGLSQAAEMAEPEIGVYSENVR